MVDNKAPNLWQVAMSVLSAMFGVQKSNIHKRDFAHGKAWQFIVIGIVLVILLLLVLRFLVHLVITYS